MVERAINLAVERMVRQAPADRPLILGEDDAAYVLDCLRAIETAFDVQAVPATPLERLPGRDLMRRLVDLRLSLRPADDDQREAWGRLASAIMRLDVAAAFTAEWGNRLPPSPPDRR